MTIIIIAMLGAMESHGSVNKYFFPRTTARPQLADGGWAPTPKKLREDSDRIAEGIFKVNSTIRDGRQFGRIWRIRIGRGFSPVGRAAPPYSASF